MKLTEHKNNYFKVNNSRAFNTFPVLCNHYLYLVPKHFQYSNIKTLHPRSSFFLYPPLITINLLSDPVDLPVLGISYKQNQTICDLLCLVPFTQHHVFEVHLCCSLRQFIIPFYDWVILCCLHLSHFVYSFICWWIFELLLPLGYCE